ncbi:uncharacterized protein BDR25DRAFT_350845 [Lindgomyces ingoldianus]|uniref:Uncharacterized protein n=1 Tax=Lindgomyces ingoldianus TaxID=673940 RepID=A0ACB6R9P2_9PLEO|nr:uncharacterized protein BDR25DRAFT_350845 [Lindgomyces ingoldianus]KAF2475478.1 hypothetical protein BDR25DRAFT_350845 [Lindgomyces ingoldianus]
MMCGERRVSPSRASGMVQPPPSELINLHKLYAMPQQNTSEWNLINTCIWPEWNSFLSAEPMDKSDDPKIFKLRTCRRFLVNIHDRKIPSIQKVVVFEIPDDTTDGPRVYRTGDGPECIYRTGEEQDGAFPHMIKMAFGKHIEKGINNWANDLKNIIRILKTYENHPFPASKYETRGGCVARDGGFNDAPDI